MVAPHDEWVVGLAGQVLFHRQPAPKGETLTQSCGGTANRPCGAS